MNILSGQNLAKIVDYSFGTHHEIWDNRLTGQYKAANISNAEFLVKCQQFEGKIMTLYIDNIRLYPRNLQIETNYPQDIQFVQYLMDTNDLLGLCAQFPKNQFIIFTGDEDTPIDDQIKLPDNVLKLYAINALYNNDRIIPFPMGLQRQIGTN